MAARDFLQRGLLIREHPRSWLLACCAWSCPRGRWGTEELLHACLLGEVDQTPPLLGWR